MEVARAHMAADPMLAPDLRLVAGCLYLLALPIAQFWKEMLLPPQLTRFPAGSQANLLDMVSAMSLVFGTVEEQRRAMAGRLKEVLLHFTRLLEILVEQGFQPPQQLGAHCCPRLTICWSPPRDVAALSVTACHCSGCTFSDGF